MLCNTDDRLQDELEKLENRVFHNTASWNDRNRITEIRRILVDRAFDQKKEAIDKRFPGFQKNNG